MKEDLDFEKYEYGWMMYLEKNPKEVIKKAKKAMDAQGNEWEILLNKDGRPYFEFPPEDNSMLDRLNNGYLIRKIRTAPPNIYEERYCIKPIKKYWEKLTKEKE